MIEKSINYKDNEKENLILKLLFNNNIINKNNYKHLHRTNKIGSKTIIRNTCIFSKRKRGILTNYKISRLQFKLIATYIPGLRISS